VNRSLLAGTRRAVSVAAHAYRDRPAAAGRCAVLAERLDGPLRVALAFERATKWHEMHPKI